MDLHFGYDAAFRYLCEGVWDRTITEQREWSCQACIPGLRGVGEDPEFQCSECGSVWQTLVPYTRWQRVEIRPSKQRNYRPFPKPFHGKRNPTYKSSTMRVSDDWCPSFEGGLIEVTIYPDETGIRVSLWGADDLGLEQHFMSESEWEALIAKAPTPANMHFFITHGFN